MNNKITFASAETCMIMDPIHSNSLGNVHGGELMKIMDNIAGIVCVKHTKGTVVTARVDEIEFHKPVHVGNIVTCTGQLAYVGTSSMQVMVNVVVDRLDESSDQEPALTAFFTMVHLVDGKPSKVPKLVINTKEEEELYKLGEKKYKEIKLKL
ncbi:acyl-CoA thioesterase [Alkalibaculum sp. M08DMB]|uniref:Acyl-CoA thioesterase n=1 Tax=Alkalibaculum sporogenes TaxID=2655001 RepID=A0A6A7K8E4_9FIRM|nr:acyl-CoA thioesterase [Alkalibaculum sporogenes]MPW25720.1 acyl-CoA thioesterase [Alkalibaculum sporogenes]